jgi:rubredoxin
MAHWMCTTCGYYLQASGPPDRCPSCDQKIPFNDVTCYRPECGGEQNIDPLTVSNTLKALKGGLKPTAPFKPASPSSKPIPLVEILMGRNVDAEEDLDQLSFWAMSQVEILRGLTKEQRAQVRSLGRIEQFDNGVTIFTEGEGAKKIYLVEEGRVAVESQVVRGMRLPISILYPGQAFGWSALVSPHLYTATVTTLYKTRVIAIDHESLDALMKSDLSLGLRIMENVASIVASRLRNLELALAGVFEQER